jgi:hypothetical protein
MDRLPGTPERRASPRVAVACPLHLHRQAGTAVDVRTVDVGPGGARVASPRPLRVDEEVRFDLDLPDGATPIGGWARVLRQHGHDMYALRFEKVSADDAARLWALTATRA